MLDSVHKLRENARRVYLGDPSAIDHVIRCLLARGHALIEDVPGVGKTVLASAVARSIDASFARIQLTPDLMPTDVIGVTVFDRQGHEFTFKPGPIFASVLLADEINRTPPRTQTALLEAMSDGSVSVDGRTHPLPQPFIVLATQNPHEFEGTYPLPENQLDRFLLRLSLGYPSALDESRLLDVRPQQTELADLRPVLTAHDVTQLQAAVDAVRLSAPVRDYIVAFARATRAHRDIRVGLSPRGSLALAHAARATAFMDARDHVIPEDVLACIQPVCAHRVITRTADSLAAWQHAAAILDEIVRTLAAPV